MIEGHHDAYIRKFAEAAKAWGKPFFLRFNWEMNGDWFAWAEGVNGNKAGEYVAAWRHVHDIFTQVGATNATWVWCPNVDPESQLPDPRAALPRRRLRRLDRPRRLQLGHQPGPAGPLAQLRRALQLDLPEDHRLDRPAQADDRSARSARPSTAARRPPGSRTCWRKCRLNYPKIRGLLWFDKFDDGMDWPIETSASATSAFAEGMQNPAYAGNTFGSLGSGAVPVSG